MNTLLLDVGNSRIKWALWNGTQISPAQATEHHGDPAQALETVAWPTVDAVYVASVFDTEANARLETRLAARCGVTPILARTQAERLGLRNAYAEPQRLGVDRWLGMLAAWTQCRNAVCVVSAGTALTLDLVDAGGQHRGGYIAPGLTTMQRAVLGATRFDYRAAEQPYADRPGRSTESCVHEAALAAALGLIERGTRGFEGQHFLTGGDGGVLRPYLDAAWQLRPDLVLEGLATVASP